MSTTSIADFATWLTNNQACALASMKANTDDGFAQHCTDFSELSAAINVLQQYELKLKLAEIAKKGGAS